MRILSGLYLLLAAAVAYAVEITPVDEVESYVNIRSGPDADADVVGRLRRGETLPSPESVDGWFRVELPDGGSGYVHADWAVVVAAQVEAADGSAQPAEAAAADEEAAAPPEPVAAEDAIDPPAGTGADSALAEPADDAPTDADAAIVAAPDPVDEPPPAAESAAVVDEPVPVVEPGPDIAPPPTISSVSTIKGRPDFVVRFKTETTGTSSQIYDDGNVVGIGTTTPQQRLEVNGSIQVNDQNSTVAGLMITQSSGDTGYILHNRASTLTIGAGSIDRITIDRAGNVGIAVARPQHPLHVANGAYLSAGGVWTNSSSRQQKDRINALDAETATAAVMALEPVSFRYRVDTAETHLGFIAEDVPDVVATADRSGLSAMDIVAVLTRVVQEQEKRIATLERALSDTVK